MGVPYIGVGWPAVNIPCIQVFVVCISAMCRLDYATQVTDIGAELINESLGSRDLSPAQINMSL